MSMKTEYLMILGGVVHLPAEMFRHHLHKIGYHLLTVAFISLAAVYGFTALRGGNV